MKLVSMKRTKQEKKAANKAIMPAEADSYPYGLRISLDDDALQKLGLKLPKVGERFHIEAVAEVCSTSAHESSDHTDRRMELQIQKLGLTKEARSMQEAVEEGIEEASDD
jgi:hypothetical protein